MEGSQGVKAAQAARELRGPGRTGTGLVGRAPGYPLGRLAWGAGGLRTAGLATRLAPRPGSLPSLPRREAFLRSVLGDPPASGEGGREERPVSGGPVGGGHAQRGLCSVLTAGLSAAWPERLCMLPRPRPCAGLLAMWTGRHGVCLGPGLGLGLLPLGSPQVQKPGGGTWELWGPVVLGAVPGGALSQVGLGLACSYLAAVACRGPGWTLHLTWQIGRPGQCLWSLLTLPPPFGSFYED